MLLFETKIKYEKMNESGAQKKVSESYLVDAMSFTEAEKKIIEEMTPFIVGEFDVSAVKKMNVAELFGEEGDMWYNAKVAFISLDEKTGEERMSASTMLVRADSFDKALDTLKECMKGTMSDWKVLSLSETSILDIFMYGEKKD